MGSKATIWNDLPYQLGLLLKTLIRPPGLYFLLGIPASVLLGWFVIGWLTGYSGGKTFKPPVPFHWADGTVTYLPKPKVSKDTLMVAEFERRLAALLEADNAQDGNFDTLTSLAKKVVFSSNGPNSSPDRLAFGHSADPAIQLASLQGLNRNRSGSAKIVAMVGKGTVVDTSTNKIEWLVLELKEKK
jgi:hypothetical protein